MITPTKITARNIRSVTDATIEPDPDGITSLTGPIGAGKSSVLTALVWALYGEVGGVPGLLVQSEMRRRGATEPVEATIEFGLNGQQFVATRTLRRSKSGKETAHAELWIDGVKQPSITPSKLTSKIVAITGLTGRAFTGAFFIAQGNLPVLAEGTPAAVQGLVEEQTGLAPLTRQVDTARAEARDAQTRADALPGSLEAVEAAQRDVDTTQRDGEAVWGRMGAAEADRDQSAARLTAATTAHTEVSTARDAARRARENVAALDATHQSLTEQLAEHRQALNDADNAGDLDAIATRGRAVAETTQALRDALTGEQHAVATVERAHAEFRAAQAATGAHPDPDGQRGNHLRTQHRAATDAAAAARAEWDRLNKALTQLQSADTSTHQCPTCTQPLPDPGALITSLRDAQQAITDRGQNAATAAARLDADLTGLVAAVQGWDTARAVVQRATERLGAADLARDTARNTVTEAQTATMAALGVAPTGDTTPASILATADTTLAELADAAANARHVHALRERVATVTSRVTDTATQLQAARDAASTGPTDNQVTHAATTMGDARAVADTARATWQQVKSEADVLTERARAAEHARDTQQRLLDTKADAATHADTLRHAHQMLVALRRDLVGEYCATISAAASDLIDTVGGGDHIGVTIGADFIPAVILSDGTTRPMRVLSGGEKMRAALCLRLGIAEQISGTGGQGMIFADEITANHDAETTRHVVQMMRSLGRPMVVIAHADEVQQIATKVYHVSKADELSGTTVRTASALAATAAAAV